MSIFNTHLAFVVVNKGQMLIQFLVSKERCFGAMTLISVSKAEEESPWLLSISLTSRILLPRRQFDRIIPNTECSSAVRRPTKCPQ